MLDLEGTERRNYLIMKIVTILKKCSTAILCKSLGLMQDSVWSLSLLIW